ncbi:hypothetical protein BC941DRAFT_268269 [Chlamydoabsidia padenii]|nr:hypothetical protein BC941DRAFT_268269 [Chlamydoabsidia padenii]
MKQMEWTSQVLHLESTVKTLQEQVQHQQTRLTEGLEREVEVTQKWKECDSKLQELNNAKFDTEAIAAFDRQIQLQDDTRKVEMENYRLKSDLKHYKEMYHNVEMLREEKYSLESKVRNMEQLVAENMRLDILNARLEAEKLEWAGYLEKEDGLGYETPQGLVYNLTKEREEARSAMDQVSSIKSELENRDKLILELENHITELKKLNLAKDRTHRADIFAMELLEKDKELLKKHVEIMENEYKLYDVEEANYMENNYDKQKTHRIQELETLLKELEDRLSSQAQDIIQSQMKVDDPSSISVSAGPYLELTSGQSIQEFIYNLSKEKLTQQQELESLQLKIKSQTNTMNILQDQLQLLKDLIRRHEMGPVSPQPSTDNTNNETVDYSNSNNTSNTNADQQDKVRGYKVLPLNENPASVEYYKHQWNKSREEVNILLKRLLQLQSQSQTTQEDVSDRMDTFDDRNEADSSAMITIPNITLTNLQSRIDYMDEVVNQKEKRIKRLLQVYKHKSDDLLDKVSSIFGYRISAQERNNVKLTPNFLKGQDVHFSVDYLKNDRVAVKLLGRKKDEYTATLDDLYKHFVLKQNYIPGFFSSVTLELSDRMVGASMIQSDDDDDDENCHIYRDEETLTDAQGHELVHPEAIDEEDELGSDFVAEADDSGDNDYVMCEPGEEEGYDGDRLAYLTAQDDQDTEDYDPNLQNREIKHQEMVGEATYVANEDVDDDIEEYEEQDHYGSLDEEDDEQLGTDFEDGSLGNDMDGQGNEYHSGSDDSESGDELDVSDDNDDTSTLDPGTGQESNPISLDDDDDDD